MKINTVNGTWLKPRLDTWFTFAKPSTTPQFLPKQLLPSLQETSGVGNVSRTQTHSTDRKP